MGQRKTVVACVLLGLVAGQTVWAQDSAARAMAGDFDAEGRISCVQRDGLPMGQCRAQVARGAEGAAHVRVTFENDFSRLLSFEDGAFLRGNTTMSGVGRDVAWRLEGGTFYIRVDDQHFELPQTLVFGE